MSINWQRDKKLDKTISQSEHSGFRTLSDNFKYLQDQLAPKKPKLTPYGNDRFSAGKGIGWITHTQQEMALKIPISDSDKLGVISNSLHSFLYKNTYLVHEV